LLKNLEEPPARTLFVLIVHAPGSLLPTIRSRCQMVRLSPLNDDELMAVLETAEPPPPDDPAARAALAQRAGGSARTAILLTQYGGLEIASTLDTLVTAGKRDIGGAFRLAEAVAGRDQAIQFDIFNRRALDLLSDAASRAAHGGDIARAKSLSDAWHEALDAISQTDTYNLDKKQHALSMIDRLNSAMRM
jgi:DNA polymerase-3 subunit delta'